MGLGEVVKTETARSQIRELAGIDPRAHQPLSGVRIRVEQVVPDLVRHGPAQHDPETMVVKCGGLRQQLSAPFVDDAAGSDRGGDGDRPRVFGALEFCDCPRRVLGSPGCGAGDDQVPRSVGPSAASVLSRSHLSRTGPVFQIDSASFTSAFRLVIDSASELVKWRLRTRRGVSAASRTALSGVLCITPAAMDNTATHPMTGLSATINQCDDSTSFMLPACKFIGA